MAPAVDMQKSDARAPKHTQELFQTAILGQTWHTTSTSRLRPTIIRTIYITITLLEDFSTSSSLSPQNLLPNSTPDSFQWPVSYGIVPGSLRVSSQSLSTFASSLTTAATTSQPRATSSTIARRSTYPRPSPPGFLYPEAIVPRVAYEQQQQPNMASGGNSNVIWYLPYGLEVLICTVMFLGITWAVLVWLINFPPRTWTLSRKDIWMFGEEKGSKERRPLDKPSKYTKSTEIDRNELGITSGAKTPALYLHMNDHNEEHGIELKHRRHQPSGHRRSHSTHTTAIRFDIPPTPSLPIDSPPNPFLSPPDINYHNLQPRSSSEWLAQHAAFFSSTSSTSSRMPSHSSDDYDIEALEAGTTPRTVKVNRRSVSWVDLGLEKVEGAVSEFVGKVARWTDDEGDGEVVLLPAVNGNGGGRREVKVE